MRKRKGHHGPALIYLLNHNISIEEQLGVIMREEESQIQLSKNVRQLNKRIDKLEEELNVIVAALKKRQFAGLEQGLKDLKEGRVHRYKSVQSLAKDVWG